MDRDRLEAAVAAELDRVYAEGCARLESRLTITDRRERDLRAARARGAVRRRRKHHR